MEAHTTLRPIADNLNPLAVGTRLQEFVVESVIGAGGFGIVYKANDTQLHRTVAIKEYMPASMAARSEGSTISLRSASHAQDFEAGKTSFISEARMLAKFKHEALIEVFRFWEQNGTAYMVTPFYEGQTLKQRLKAMAVLPDEVALKQALLPVLDALEHMHLEQVYHRDISPDNIMVLNDGKPILLDLGAARRLETENAQALTVLVKPGYAPIEQYAVDSGVQQGPWTDIYGWGASAYYALTGKPPPPSASRIMSDSIVKLAGSNLPGYSEEFLAAIDAALAVRPDDRPQSIAALKAMFDSEIPTLKTIAVEPEVLQVPENKATLSVEKKSTSDDVSEKFVPSRLEQTTASKVQPKKPVSIGLISGCLLCVVGLLCAFLWFAKTPAPVGVAKSSSPAPIQKADAPNTEQASRIQPIKVEVPVVVDVPKNEVPKVEVPKVEVQKTDLAKIEPVKDAVLDKPAQVRLSIKPWGEVFVNGQSKGVSPPTKSLTLAAGEYTVEVRNGDYPAHKVSIKISAGEVFKLNHAFVDTVQKQ
jgi:serine/threonine protein kinase